MRRDGFTLIELLVVIAIISILATVAVMNVGQYMERAKRGKATLDLDTLAKAVESYYTFHNGAFPGSLEVLEDENFLSSDLPKAPWGGEYLYGYRDGTDRLRYLNREAAGHHQLHSFELGHTINRFLGANVFIIADEGKKKLYI